MICWRHRVVHVFHAPHTYRAALMTLACHIVSETHFSVAKLKSSFPVLLLFQFVACNGEHVLHCVSRCLQPPMYCLRVYSRSVRTQLSYAVWPGSPVFPSGVVCNYAGLDVAHVICDTFQIFSSWAIGLPLDMPLNRFALLFCVCQLCSL